MNWDSTVDVLVVGSGNGGMTAALCAYEMGAKNVLVIEKGDKYGGTSSYSGGGIWVPCSHYTIEAGAEDSLAEAREYLAHAIPEGAVEPAMLDAYIESGPEMLRFMHDRTWVRYESLEHYPDYYSELPGAKNGHRSHEPAPVDMSLLGDEAQHLMPVHPMMRFLGRVGITQVEAQLLYVQAKGWKSMIGKMLLSYALDIPWRFKTKIARRLTCGSAGVARLRISMMDRNMPLWRNTRLVELVREDGRVQGAVIEREGKRMTIKATRGVILAAGGFEQNQAMRDRYLPKPTDTHWSAGVKTNTGDAINAGTAVGAAFKLVDGGWWFPVLCVPGEEIPYLAIMEKSYPGTISVNREGKRVANESMNYMAYVKEAFSVHSAEHPSAPLYMIFDANFRAKYLVGPLMKQSFRPDYMLPKIYYEEGFLAKADTLDELAKQAGIDPQGLKRSVELMNVAARTGKDTEFGRGDSAYDRYYGDPTVTPNPCLGSIVKPPFYAVRMELGDFGTQGGLVTDTNGQVRDTEGVPIPGLYATGNCSAAILPTYPGPGSTLGPAMTFAYRAARHLTGANR
jgi:3-oxosteroid 1-dehydrogenase